MTDQPANPAAASGDNARQLLIQKVYLKDASFESPNTPEMFATAQWDPKVQLNITTHSKNLGGDLWEVMLHLTIEAKQSDRAAFLCEIKQAGIFTLRGFPEEDRRRLLGGYCPSLVFPYVREAVSDLVTKGGFPQLLLQPLNFEALYLKHVEEGRQAAAAPSTEGTH